MLALDVACVSWFSGAQVLEPPAGIAAAQFGVSRDGQEPRGGGGLLPFLAADHGVVQGLFALLVVVAQSAVGGGQGLVPGGAVVVTVLAGGVGFGGGADGVQSRVEGAEPGQPQLLSDVAGSPGGSRRRGCPGSARAGRPAWPGRQGRWPG
jgi:hypothetical protein